MRDKFSPTWRDNVSERLGAIEQGLQDIKGEFAQFREEFRILHARISVGKEEAHAETVEVSHRVRSLEDSQNQSKGKRAVITALIGGCSGIGAALMAALVKWFFHKG